VKSRMASSKAVLFPIQLEAKPTASSRVGKNAKNKLNAIACDMIPQRGNTRANTFQTLIAKSDLALLRIIAVACPTLPDFLPQLKPGGSDWLLSPHSPCLPLNLLLSLHLALLF
jgi:hypothetical protein